MNNNPQRSSTARIVSIIVLFGIIPLWFFYIGVKYNKTMSILEENQNTLNNDLNNK